MVRKNLKMKWKHFPTWLKGGILVVSIQIILLIFVWLIFLIILIISSLTNYIPSMEVREFLLGIILLGHLIAFFPGAVLFELGLRVEILFVVESVIIYFLIGALIGWIVGKVKRKKGCEGCERV